MNKIIPLAILVGAVLLGAAFMYSGDTSSPLGEAPSGLNSRQVVATTTEVGPQQKKTLFSANSYCSSRVIRTQAEPVFLLFADPTNGDLSSTTLTAVAGFFQAASTTVVYDSGLYGCGRVMAHAIASSTISTAEFR